MHEAAGIKGTDYQRWTLKEFLPACLCSQKGRKREHLIPVRKHLGPLHKHSLTLWWVILRVKGRLLKGGFCWFGCAGAEFFFLFNLNRLLWGHGVVLSRIVPVLSFCLSHTCFPRALHEIKDNPWNEADYHILVSYYFLIYLMYCIYISVIFDNIYMRLCMWAHTHLILIIYLIHFFDV